MQYALRFDKTNKVAHTISNDTLSCNIKRHKITTTHFSISAIKFKLQFSFILSSLRRKSCGQVDDRPLYNSGCHLAVDDAKGIRS